MRLSNKEIRAAEAFYEKIKDLAYVEAYPGGSSYDNCYLGLDGSFSSQELEAILRAMKEYFEDLEREETENGT